jgi:phosphoserine phosphatase
MLITFDMDGTLIKGNSWSRLDRHFGVEDLALRCLEDYLKGLLNYRDFLNSYISLWGKNIHISIIESTLSNYTLSPGAIEVVSGLHRRGHTTAIITVGLDILANKVASRLKIPNVMANGLEVDERGYLTGKVVCRVELLRKDIALKSLMTQLGISQRECVAIGDSKYDRTMLEAASLGIAYKADHELVEAADVSIIDLREIPTHISRYTLSNNK